MAIKIDVENSAFGVGFAGAYFRIVTAAVTRTRNPEERFSVMIDIAGYAVEPTNDDTKEVDFRRYHVPYSIVAAIPGDNIFEKCYGWVSQQSDMVGAIPA